MDKAQGQQKARGRVHFLLQKNTGNDERLFIASKEVRVRRFFHVRIQQPVRGDVLGQHTSAHRKDPPVFGKESTYGLYLVFKANEDKQLTDKLEEAGLDITYESRWKQYRIKLRKR